ncbi:hypothetical protein PR048_020428 [Dryococelus australis]|uniref:Uncharacterized protein n=1 Tax=Dryococelus australis TaxID=614101 RepID=A0ABQ9H6E8_9NEOP|nr:hypothetical protein PR048_020428 [Dryococelus australis]
MDRSSDTDLLGTSRVFRQERSDGDRWHFLIPYGSQKRSAFKQPWLVRRGRALEPPSRARETREPRKCPSARREKTRDAEFNGMRVGLHEREMIRYLRTGAKKSMGRGGVVVRLLTSHQGQPGSISGGIAPGFSQLGIVRDDIAGRWVFSGISRFPRSFIFALLHTHRTSLSSALRTSPNLFTNQLKSRARAPLEGEIGDRRENPPTSGIVWHDSHMGGGDLGATPRGIEPGSRRWEASRLTTAALGKKCLWKAQFQKKVKEEPKFESFKRHLRTPHVVGATVAERLARSPPAKANRAQSPAGSTDFRKWESCQAMSLGGGFSRESPTSPAPPIPAPLHIHSITLIGSEDLNVKSHPNLFSHSLLTW